jgi:formate hydrogenlyase subunit 3/multisubunit Na+/H+ antiporter MnhD subunit
MKILTIIAIILLAVFILSSVATMIYMFIYKAMINRRLHEMDKPENPHRSLIEPLKFFLISALIFCVLGFFFLSFVQVGV